MVTDLPRRDHLARGWDGNARGDDEICGSLFSYIDRGARIRADHPLRPIREIANKASAALLRDFAVLYSAMGRPPVPPGKLRRAMLLQAFCSAHSARQPMERIEFDLLFRWFVGIGIDDPVWGHSTFTKNRDRLLAGEIAARFLTAVLVAAADRAKQPPGNDGGRGGSRNARADFKGRKRSNETHRSTTDPDARLYRKGPGMGRESRFYRSAGQTLVEACARATHFA